MNNQSLSRHAKFGFEREHTTAPSQQAEADALIRLYAVGEEFTTKAFAEALGVKYGTAFGLLAYGRERGLVVVSAKSRWVRV